MARLAGHIVKLASYVEWIDKIVGTENAGGDVFVFRDADWSTVGNIKFCLLIMSYSKKWKAERDMKPPPIA